MMKLLTITNRRGRITHRSPAPPKVEKPEAKDAGKVLSNGMLSRCGLLLLISGALLLALHDVQDRAQDRVDTWKQHEAHEHRKQLLAYLKAEEDAGVKEIKVPPPLTFPDPCIASDNGCTKQPQRIELWLTGDTSGTLLLSLLLATLYTLLAGSLFALLMGLLGRFVLWGEPLGKLMERFMGAVNLDKISGAGSSVTKAVAGSLVPLAAVSAPAVVGVTAALQVQTKVESTEATLRIQPKMAQAQTDLRLNMLLPASAAELPLQISPQVRPVSVTQSASGLVPAGDVQIDVPIRFAVSPKINPCPPSGASAPASDCLTEVMHDPAVVRALNNLNRAWTQSLDVHALHLAELNGLGRRIDALGADLIVRDASLQGTLLNHEQRFHALKATLGERVVVNGTTGEANPRKPR